MGTLTGCRTLARGAFVLCSCASMLLAACERQATVIRLPALPLAKAAPAVYADHVSDDLNPRLLRRFAALPPEQAGANPHLVMLGRMLYFEPRLSSSGKISCDTCHPLSQYGATRTAFSVGVDGKLGRRNAPSVYNTAGHFRLFWDGRAATLSDQAKSPLEDPTEMGMSAERIVEVLHAIPGYRAMFNRAFPAQAQPITVGNVTDAIAAFERGLITPSRWDRYLHGDTRALSVAEKEGAKLFANLGCMVCHAGPYVGGTMFEKLGVFVPWPDQKDRGRSEITHNPADDMVFKVPSLRNVAQTPPYFHDGSADSLETAVRMMARHQLGVDLSEEEAASIATWLGSLTGEIPAEYIARPQLPPANGS